MWYVNNIEIGEDISKDNSFILTMWYVNVAWDAYENFIYRVLY